MVEAAQPQGNVALPLVDARRGEFYGGFFRRGPAQGAEGRELALVGDGFVATAAYISSRVRDLIRSGDPAIEIIARQHDQAALEFAARLPPPVSLVTVPGFLVGAIADVARRAARKGRLQQPEELDAWYIRRSDAEVNWRE
jgi:hypothetical protein